MISKQKVLLAVFSLLVFSCQPSTKEETKPNILFLFTDDQTYNAIQQLGNSQIKTPHLDKLFQSGTTFSHAFNMGSWSGAVCTASRSMIASGMTVWNANKHRVKWQQRDSSAIAESWPKLLEAAGYDTYASGKWHIDIPGQELFQNTVHMRPGMPRDAWRHANMVEKLNAEKSLDSETLARLMPNGYNRPLSTDDNSWSPTDTTKGGYWEGGKHWSEVLKEDAINFIDAAKEKENPFFMYVAFNAPHDPRQAPQKYQDMYPLEDIEVPESYMPDYPFHDGVGLGPKLRDEALGPFPRTELAVKTAIKEYYALISHLDVQIGGIIDKLEKEGLMDNTYIFMTADHGLAVGKHGLLGKQNMYDHSMRVPLLVSGPNVPAGNIVDTDVYLQDLMPTGLEIGGVAKPDFVEFNSLLPHINTPETATKLDGVYGAYLNVQRMIRKDGFKLIMYPKINETLLFDMNNDPLELKDLSNMDEHLETKKALFEAFEKLQSQYNDELDLSGMIL